MKDEQHIDNIFNRGLDSNGLDYNSAHWNDMDAILNESIPVSNWPAVRWAKLFALGITFLTLGFYFGFNQGEKVASETALSTAIEIDQLKSTVQALKLEQQQSTQALSTQAALVHAKANQPETLPFIKKERPINSEKMVVQAVNNKRKETISNVEDKGVDTGIDQFEALLLNQDQIEDVKQETPALSNTENLSLQEFYTQMNAKAFDGPFSENRALSFVLNSKTDDLILAPPKKWHLYLEPWVGYAQNSRIIKKDVLSGFKLEETPLNSWNYGANVVMKKRNLAIKTGLELRRYQETQAYLSETTNWTYDTTLKIVIKEYGETGSGNRLALLDEIIDSTSTTQKSTCLDCIMSVAYISIPLSVQYLKQWRKFTVYGEVGVNYALRKSIMGNYTSRKNEERWDVEEARTVLKENWVGAKIGGGLIYKVSPKVNIFSGVETNRSLTSLTSSYTQNLQQTTLKTGIQVKVW